jgi:hypothetical protein
MATTVNQKIANPSILGNSTTGTGNIVLSESPTINNANLTGNVTANVNLRSGSLQSLLGIAGGNTEVGYATDYNTLVRFNGNAGGAKVLGSYGSGTTLEFLLTDASYAANTPANPIDCTYVSLLKIINTPAFSGDITNISIKLPSSEFKATLTVQFIDAPAMIAAPGITFTLDYNAYDVTNGSNIYIPVPADQGSAIPKLWQLSTTRNETLFQFVFYYNPLVGWTRTSPPGQAYTNNTNEYVVADFDINSAPYILIGSYIDNIATGTYSATDTTVNLGAAIDLPQGVWSVSGRLRLTAINAPLVITDFTAELLSTSDTGAINVSNGGVISQRVPNTIMPGNRAIAYPFTTRNINNPSSTPVPYYNRVNISFSNVQYSSPATNNCFTTTFVQYSSPATNNCFTTTNNTRTVKVTITNHGAVSGEQVTFSGATAVGGLTALQLNSTFTVSYLNANEFNITVTGSAATSTATGGGTGITATITTVKVTITNHGSVSGAQVTFSGVTGTFGGISAAQLNSTFTVSYLNANQFNIIVLSPAPTSNATGGGTGITATFQSVVEPVIEYNITRIA